MKTRDLILDTALKLFNKSGLDNVSLRQIARQAGLSQSNVTYHFKHPYDIFKELFAQFKEKIMGVFNGIEKKHINLLLYIHIISKASLVQQKYAFIMHNIIQMNQYDSEFKKNVYKFIDNIYSKINFIFIQLEKKSIISKSIHDKKGTLLSLRWLVLWKYSLSHKSIIAKDDYTFIFQIKNLCFVIYPLLSSKSKEAFDILYQNYEPIFINEYRIQNEKT
ncbi:TetR/AcrR family transcriptional regulator [Aureibacter tunicatorum]|uniref:HTH tetR-type domain-containing protein n=1 Tax=Aureibacter tunicatorum TaxID=866807 RepID=A0AAE3XSH3_9BACT|nr:TetR/AcrR family transcriptional regulator [Aureibacter tunicatorum]MDR6240724.1 hypothetical protein [Aureibacter tunicatorum]